MTAHTWYTCPKPCERNSCPFCDGGLGSCTVCRCAEGTLPSECPGAAVSMEDQERIYAGALDYRAGAWVEKPSGGASSHYDGRPGLPEDRACG